MTKGIVLAGGMGTRMAPCTTVTNKHLLPVGNCPMVFHPLNLLKKMGIKDIMVIVGGESIGEFLELMGSGAKYGLNLTFRVQDEPSGIAGALLLTEDFVGESNVAVILGDNIFDPDDFSENDPWDAGANYCYNRPMYADGIEAKLFLKSVKDANRFGVATFDKPLWPGEKRVIKIVEKPKQPETDLAVTGLYIYSAHADLFSVLKTLKPSDRGELEITDVNNYFVDRKACRAKVVEGFWSDAGTWDSWKISNDWAFDNLDKMKL